MNSSMRKARILVIALGGTIVSTGEDGVVPAMGADQLIASVPDVTQVADVDTLTFRQVPSGDVTLSDLVALSRLIVDAAARGVDGVVVTQGTDTLEECSFALDILLDVPCAVVVTGALRNPTMASADGPHNLLGAIAVAASPVARGLGCLVVMNDEVHAARFVRKVHARRR